jgi:hypothetical protein
MKNNFKYKLPSIFIIIFVFTLSVFYLPVAFTLGDSPQAPAVTIPTSTNVTEGTGAVPVRETPGHPIVPNAPTAATIVQNAPSATNAPPNAPDTANAANAPNGAPTGPPIILSIQYGKGGTVQQYTLQSGQSIFVPIGMPANPSQTINPQEERSTQAYQQQLSHVSDQIAGKITAIQKKQSEIDTEVYMVYRTPLGIEKQALEQDLRNLELRRDQLNSQITAREGLKPVVQPQAPSTIMNGLTVKATIKEGKVVLDVSYGSGKSQIKTTIKGPPDQWLQIFAAEKGKGKDIWARVTPQAP